MFTRRVAAKEVLDHDEVGSRPGNPKTENRNPSGENRKPDSENRNPNTEIRKPNEGANGIHWNHASRVTHQASRIRPHASGPTDKEGIGVQGVRILEPAKS